MADNFATALKNLNKELNEADVKIRAAQGDSQALFDTIVRGVGISKDAFRSLVSELSGTNIKGARTIDIVTRLVDENGKKLTPKSIEATIENITKNNKPQTLGIFQYKTSDMNTLQQMLAMSKKDAADLFDIILKISNKSVAGGGKKSQASKEWKDQTKLSNEAKKAAAEAQDEYIKQTQAAQQLTKTLEELRAKRAELESLPVTGIGKAGESFKSETTKANAIKRLDAEIVKIEKDFNDATVAAQGFEAKLIAIGQGKRVSNMKKALGIDVVEPEMQKIPTVFDRVIEQINQRAAQSKDKFAKQLVNAEGLKNEARNAASQVSHELNYIWRGSQAHYIEALKKNNGYLTEFGRQSAVNQIRLSWSYKSNLDDLKTQETRERITEALKRYRDTLQSVLDLEEKQRRNSAQYAAQERAVNGVTRRFNENEQAIARVRDRWEELNVKKQAGLVSQKDFDTQTQKILDEYDRLIAKKKEFEIGDLGQLSSQRKQFQERYKELLKEKDAAEKARIARGLSSTDPNMNAAVNKQIQYQRQLIALRKEYNALNNKQNRTQEENAILEQTKNKIKEIIGLSKQLNKEQQGSHGLAKQITDYDRIKQKIHDANKATKEHKASLESLLLTSQRLASAFGVAFSVQGLVQFGRKLVETRGEFELQQVALRSILQNKQVADEIWDKTMQAALQSPFAAMQLTKYTKQLAAYRIETEKLFDTTKRLADVSAGLGVDMQRLILAYGQVKAANYLRASEIRQFTEAGVNILGELSTYLSKTRGEMISTAQVMDMVQKRMVKFEDVEAIFKRMTDAGGIFYEMQYIQSQTVKGQLNKLHDAYDQMLNNIGKANQGAIRDLVGLLNNIVKNWREWKTVIDLIAWPLIISTIYKFGRGLMYANASAILTKKSINGVTRAGARMQVMMKSLYTTMASNPWLAIATAIAAATVALINHAKQVKFVQDQIMEQNTRLYETQEQLKGYQTTIENNNKAIKDNKTATDSNKLSTDELNKKKEENREILAKLTNDYPELVKNMKLEEDGTITLTDAITKYNDELERQMTLKNILAQNSGGSWLGDLFSDTYTTNLTEYMEGLSKLKGELISAQSMATTLQMRMHLAGEDNLPFYGALQQIKDLDLSDVEKAAGQYRNIIQSLYSDVLTGYTGEHNTPVYERSYVGGAKKYMSELPQLSSFLHDAPTAKKAMEENADVFMGMFEESISQISDYEKIITEKYNGDVAAFVADNTELINKGIVEGNADVVSTIRTVLQTQGGATTKEAKVWYNKVLNEYLTFHNAHAKIAALEAQVSAEREKKYKNQDHQLIADAQREIEEIKNSLIGVEEIDFFASSAKTNTNGTGGEDGKGDKTKENASRMLSLIKEMRAEYDKLAKSAYGYAKSENTVRDAYRESYEAILQKTGVPAGFDFTTNEGEIKAMERLRDYLKANAKKYTKDAWKDVQKEIDKLQTEININAKLRDRENFKREMEDMLGDYELTIELQNLSISEDAAKRLFDDESFQYINIGNLRKRMQELYNLRGTQGEGFSQEDIELFEKYENKIEEILFKQRKEKAKEYSKFVKKELDERAKIEMQYAKDRAFILANDVFTGDETSGQKKNLLDELEKKHEEDLQELHWKSFKESDFYIEMMEDLSSIPSDYARMMLEKLDEIIANPNISPRAMKEAIKAREKVIAAQISLRPLQSMTENLAGAKKAYTDNNLTGFTATGAVNQLNALILAKQKDVDLTEEEIELYDRVAGELKNYEDAQTAVKNALVGTGLDETASIETIEETMRTLEDRMADQESQLHTGANLTPAQERENQQREVAIGILREEIQALKDLAEAKRNVNAIQLSDEAREALNSGIITTTGADGSSVQHQVGNTSTSVLNAKSKKQTSLKDLRKQLQELKNGKKSVEDFAKSWHAFNAQMGDTISKMGSMGSAFMDTYEALGGETNALTEGWKEFGSTMVDVVVQALEMLPTLVTGFTAAGTAINAAMGIIGLIAEAIQLVLTAITAISKLHDAGVDYEIEKHQKTLDDLIEAYEDLEDAIKGAMSSAQYISDYDAAVQNLNQQIEEANAQIAAAQDYKNDDKREEATANAEDAIEDAQEKLKELKKDMQETFLGFNTDDFRSMTEDFVSAWLDAYEETGDGFDAMMDNFEETMKKWFIKQAVMRLAGAKMETLLNQMVAAIDEDGNGGVAANREEIEAIRERAALLFAGLNDDLKELYSIWGLGGDDTLSGLAAGIQGMTEEQANVLEAYWNSVRQMTASIDSNVASIALILGAGGVNTNPMLTHLQTIADNTSYIQSIYELLAPLQTNGGNGRGFRTYPM